MPAISVIVPTRKRNHLLPRCLRSLYAQTWRDFEIVLVDDNPPESRVARDASLAPLLADGRLRLIENRVPCNAASARNRGLREARGEWVTYLDDDDAYQPRKLDLQLRMALDTKAPLVSCGLTYHVARRTRRYNTSAREFSGDDLLLVFPGMSELFHRAAEVRFDESLSGAEDIYFYQALLQRFDARRVPNVPEALVDHYLHRGPRVSANGEAVWQGALSVHRDFGRRYGDAAREVFLLRSRLAYCRAERGAFRELLAVSWRLARMQGMKDARAIAGAVLFQFAPLRPFIVS